MSKLQHLHNIIMSCNDMWKLRYGERICFVLVIKHKYARHLDIVAQDDICHGEYAGGIFFLLDCIFFVLFNKTKICKFQNEGGSHVTFFWRQKTTFCTHQKRVTIMVLFFIHYYINLFCYFFVSNLHKSQKNSRKWTSMMSKIDIDERLLGKIDAH